MAKNIRAIETFYNGYRFRSRLEARWAIFFSAVGLEYEYEIEGYNMGQTNYLPDFYIPSLDRWFEIKGHLLNVEEMKKCEEFCFRTDNENIKFSILIGAPALARLETEEMSILGIQEFTWEWPCELYPENVRILAKGLAKEEYYSRFLTGIWKIPNVDDSVLIEAVKKARSARFEFGETPKS